MAGKKPFPFGKKGDKKEAPKGKGKGKEAKCKHCGGKLDAKGKCAKCGY